MYIRVYKPGVMGGDAAVLKLSPASPVSFAHKFASIAHPSGLTIVPTVLTADLISTIIEACTNHTGVAVMVDDSLSLTQAQG